MQTFKEQERFEDVIVKRQTAKAILCKIEGEEVWVPQSQVDDESEVWKEGDEGVLVVSEWFGGITRKKVSGGE